MTDEQQETLAKIEDTIKDMEKEIMKQEIHMNMAKDILSVMQKIYKDMKEKLESEKDKEKKN